jgi:sugar porter (SP) family MFS transporter
MTLFALAVLLFAALGGILFGFQISVIAGSLAFVSQEFSLSLWEEGMAVSMVVLGALCGSCVSGSLADLWGRKRKIMLADALFILGTLMLMRADSFSTLLIGRFATGVAVGVTSLVIPLYLAEIAPVRHRGAFVASYQLAITLGILFAYGTNLAFTAAADWRAMFAVGLVPAAIQLLGTLFLPESPSWLHSRGRTDRALAVLGRLRRKGANVLEEILHPPPAKEKGQGWKRLCAPPLRRPLLLGVALSMFQQITGINAVIYYAPKVFAAAGYASASTAMLATLSIGVVNVLATLFSLWLLDRAGRRLLLLVGVAGMAVSLGALAWAFLAQSGFVDRVAVVSLMAYVASFAIGLGPVTWVLISEIYPLQWRGRAMSVATCANWLFNYLVALTFLDLSSFLGSGGAFLLYACLGVWALAFIYRRVPETKGKSLVAIETYFKEHP